MQAYVGETGEKEKQSSSWVVVRNRSEETKVMKNGLVLVACVPSKTRVTFRPGLLPRAIPGLVILLESVLTSMTHVATKGRGDAWGQSRYLWPFWYSRAMLLLELS